MSGLANLARRSPTLIAFCPADDNEYIYVGQHSISVYLNDPLHPLGFDSNVITLVGNDPNTCQPVALPATAFAQCDICAKTIAEIRGAAGFAAAPPVLRQGPHGGGTVDTDNLSVRPVMLIPVEAIPDIMKCCILSSKMSLLFFRSD